MRRATSIPVAVTVTALSVGVGHASSIGVFFEPDGSDCDGSATAGIPFTVYIGAVLGGDAAADGISTAQFRLDGVDAAWFAVVTPSPAANLTIGTPIGGSCGIAFPSCETGPYVPLYTIQLIAPGSLQPTMFTIRFPDLPSNPWFCPLVTKCDGPVFTKVCVSGGQAFLNYPNRPCSVAVRSDSWSKVKRLFQ